MEALMETLAMASRFAHAHAQYYGLSWTGSAWAGFYGSVEDWVIQRYLDGAHAIWEAMGALGVQSDYIWQTTRQGIAAIRASWGF